MVGHTEYFVVRDVIYKYLPPTVRRTDRTSRDIITYTAYLLHVLQCNVRKRADQHTLADDVRLYLSKVKVLANYVYLSNVQIKTYNPHFAWIQLTPFSHHNASNLIIHVFQFN